MKATIARCILAVLAVLLLIGPLAIAFAGDLPDAVATPGATNPAVTQETIAATVCAPGWTDTVRPSARYTNGIKAIQLADGPYKSDEPPQVFEEDHLISLELGGHPSDMRNLWPQHWSAPYGAHQKDQLENYLKRAVCAGKMTLQDAQFEIAADWVAAYIKHIGE